MSYSLQFYTRNPYKQSYTNTILDGSTITQMTACPTRPGLQLNGFIYNSRGFETPDLSYEKPSNTSRVLLLGDSFAVGVVPYHKHFFRLLESGVHQKYNASPSRYEFINLGIGCIGPAIEKRVLELEGIKYKPDVILLTFYIGNDFTDDEPREDAYTKQINGLLESFRLPAWALESRIISLTTNLAIRLTKGRQLASYEPPEKSNILGVYTGGDQVNHYDPFRPVLSDQEYHDGVRRDIGIYYHSGYNNLFRVQQNILLISELALTQKAKLLVIVIPAEIQINIKLQKEILLQEDGSTETVDIRLPQKTIISFLESNNISYIDMLPIFENNQNPASLYQSNDGHLNIFGEQVVAAAVYPWLLNALK